MNTAIALAPDAPWVAAPTMARPSEQATLQRSLLAAVLLHLALVLAIGTAPGGALRVGDSVWGALQITIDGPGPKDSPGHSEQALPYTGPVGQAARPRWGGEVQHAPDRPSPEPGARELGTWNPRPAPGQAMEAHPTPGPTADQLSMPAMTHDGPGKSSPPSGVAPANAAPPAPALAPAPRAERPHLEPSTAPRLAPLDKVEAPVLEHREQTAREIARTMPTRTAAEAAATALPAPPAAAKAEPPLAQERTSAPATPLAPPLATPSQTRGDPAASRAQETAPDVQTPVPTRTLPSPAVAPQPPALPQVPPVASPRPATEEAAPAPRSVAAPAPAASTPLPSTPTSPGGHASGTALEPPTPGQRDTAAAQAQPDAPLASRQAPPQVGAGAPRAGAQVGADRATPPAAPLPGAPLNLELPRPRGAVPSAASKGLLNLVPPPPDTRSKLAQDIEKSSKTDCRKAYSNMGPLAVIPLLADAVRAEGCKW